MANICENYLDVYGDESIVARAVQEWVTDEEVLFDEELEAQEQAGTMALTPLQND